MRSKTNQSRVWAWALLGLVMTGNVRADVLFSNLGDDDSWDHDNAYVLEFAPAGKAMPFMASFTGSFTSVELPLGIVEGTNQFIVELRADDNGSPGEVLESFVVQDVPYLFVEPETLSVAVSVVNPVLEQDATYWVAAFPGADDTTGGWNWTCPLQTGVWAATPDGGDTWEFNPFVRTEISAFRINADPLE